MAKKDMINRVFSFISVPPGFDPFFRKLQYNTDNTGLFQTLAKLSKNFMNYKKESKYTPLCTIVVIQYLHELQAA